MKYRPDIDGLRAIAVMLVILFHAKTGIFSGGYIGVDVFFAISGFLITSIIYTKMLAGTFSFKDFYKRRAKRLLPASLFMTLVTVLLFSLIYPPDLFKTLSESAITSILFASNIYFWQTAGYFSSSIELQPLLHTWSLSVEEQFYFLFPLGLLLLITLKLNKLALFAMLALVCLVSLVLAIVYAPNNLSFIGFYVLPTRFYEMGLGALLAIFMVHNSEAFKNIKYLREFGLIMILSAAYFYDKSLAFPSYYPLLPVIGTLMMIMDSRKSGITYRFLCSKPTIFIGLLSYSLYLWHWPIWVLFQWLSNEQTLVSILGYFIVTFGISYASYALIEKPMRTDSFYRSRLKSGSAFASFTFLAVALAYFTTSSNRALLPINSIDIRAYKDSLQHEPFREDCTDTKRLRGEYSICTIHYSQDAKYSVLLWGDSHASAMMSALSNFSSDFNVSAINTTGCPSLIGIRRKNDIDCHLHNDYVKDYLQHNSSKYDLILKVSAWNNYIEMDLLEGDLSAVENIRAGIIDTISFYNTLDLNYLFISQVPRYDEDIPLAFFRFKMGLAESMPKLSKVTYLHQLNAFKKLFPTGSNVTSFGTVFCDEINCAGLYGNLLLYQDSHHISVAAGQLLSSKIEYEIKTLITLKKEVN